MRDFIEKFANQYFCIINIAGCCYLLQNQNRKFYEINIEFDTMSPIPQAGDRLYLSENMLSDMNDNLRSFTFSTKTGKKYARKPHNFLKNPEEFLIFEYQNGKTVLLERWYG